MIFKGERFTKSKTVVMLPKEMWDKCNVTFGKVVPKGQTPPANAVQTEYKWVDKGQGGRQSAELKTVPVFAVPIPCDGHSLTNLMFGKPNRQGKYRKYLLIDGHVFTASRVLPKDSPRYLRLQKELAQQ